MFIKPGQSSLKSADVGIMTAKNVSHAKTAAVNPTGGLAKRAIDIAIASTALIALSPLLILVGILIKATSKGPVVFWSWRTGFLGRPFLMPKFRTLYISAPVESRETLGDAAHLYTPVGRLLRKSSIDEFPQFWSILIGDMSLIGPRPLLMHDIAASQRLARNFALHSRPGITGLAQINGRNHLTPRKKVSYDVAYARHWSWQMEIKIVVGTIRYVFTGYGVI